MKIEGFLARQDRLGVVPALPATLQFNAVTGVFSVSGIPAGTLVRLGSDTVRVNLSSGISVEGARLILSAIAFANISQNPSAAARTARITLADSEGAYCTPSGIPVNVIPVNDPTVVLPECAGTITGTSIKLSHLLDNDWDYEGQALTVSIVEPLTAGGAGVSSSAGVVIYTPALSFGGLDWLRYRVTDSGGAYSDSRILITVFPTIQGVPCKLLSVTRQPGTMTARFFDAPAISLGLETSGDLQIWTPRGNFVPDARGEILFSDITAPNHLFVRYRT